MHNQSRVCLIVAQSVIVLIALHECFFSLISLRLSIFIFKLIDYDGVWFKQCVKDYERECFIIGFFKIETIEISKNLVSLIRPDRYGAYSKFSSHLRYDSYSTLNEY